MARLHILNRSMDFRYRLNAEHFQHTQTGVVDQCNDRTCLDRLCLHVLQHGAGVWGNLNSDNGGMLANFSLPKGDMVIWNT